jgi:hypothetical protein
MNNLVFHNITQEEHNFALGFGMTVASEDELLARVARMHLDGSERVKTNLKKMMVVYNLLKKLWDESDSDGFIKFLRLFLKTNRIDLVSICITSTLSVDLAQSMENAETAAKENDYLVSANYLKFLYDLRKEVGLTNPSC